MKKDAIEDGKNIYKIVKNFERYKSIDDATQLGLQKVELLKAIPLKTS